MTFGALLVTLVPLAVLVALLLAGRYPGERVLRRFRERLRDRWSERLPSAPALRELVAAVFARGGRLIADSLAGRGPPPAATFRSV